jgi:heptosyltransferase-2
MKLALFLPNWVGDAVMATPALSGIRARFASAEIIGVMQPVIDQVLVGAGFFDRTLDITQPGFLQRLKSEGCDTAVLLPNSFRSAWLAWRSGARRRIGFARDMRGWLLTDWLTPRSKSEPHPVLDEYLRIAEHLGCDVTSRRMTLAVSRSNEAVLDQFWARYPKELRGAGVLCFNTGGAFGPAKNWPREYFAELAQRIVDQTDRTVLILCGPAEREEARWISEKADRARVLSLAGEPLSIGLTKAAIREAELLISTDSGPRHFAAAFDVPVITLFGPTHIAWSETHYSRAVHLQVPVDCGPCQQRECALGHHRCMRDLTVDCVFAAVKEQLEQNAGRVAA